MTLPIVSCRAYSAMQNLNIRELTNCRREEIRPLLPSLVRMSLLLPMENDGKSDSRDREQILSLLVGIEVVNNIVTLLQIEYDDLEMEVKKEQQLRMKLSVSQQDTAQIHGLQNGIAHGFERADVVRKVRIVLSEFFYMQAQINEQVHNGTTGRNVTENIKQSELFDNDIYLEEITDILCIALAELPSLVTVQELVDALIYVNHGPAMISWIVANVPDSYKEIVTNLISTGDEETPEGKLKLAVLYALSDMNPGQALTTRSICVDMMKMPSLMLKLSLKDPQDLIAFISGLLLGNDQNVRSWFALFIRTSQKRKGDALNFVREELLKQLKSLVELSHNTKITLDDCTVQATAILRLYAALRGIANIKFVDDELRLLIQLVTTKPPPTQAGIRFVSLGLCMLIACPSLISQPALEAKSIEWMQWLVKEEAYFESKCGISTSFGEMLLLMAIHFHSSQISAIAELVCSTLAMKIPIRPNNVTRMKQIFTTEIFTEQVVTAHAVKVPVTMNLNANIPGYLPVHCIHQLLKSRAFSKHKVPIKSWIYKQICNSTVPLHPVMPALIEVYVNSLIIPNSNRPTPEHMHKPLSEAEILKVFKNSVVGYALDKDSTEGDLGNCSNVTSQLLILYYLVLYEDIRLANMTHLILNARKVKAYSSEFMSELPIKYLLQQAQKHQHLFTGLFHPLLRLSVTHFPHLSLVDDWIEQDSRGIDSTKAYKCISHSVQLIQERELQNAFQELELCPSKLIKLLRVMLKKPPSEIWNVSQVFVSNIKKILGPNIPRLVRELYRKVWMSLNGVLPRRLWTMTINALVVPDVNSTNQLQMQDNLLLDPLQALRCDSRVFRCPDVLVIILRILQASLAASKSQLNRFIQDKPSLDKNGQIQSESEREELKTALIASQDSAAVQILLEACLETDDDLKHMGKSWCLREIRGVICSYIHQVFISEPSLAKLVHFQTYSRDLLNITTRGVPSMHICLDFLPEILTMPEMGKQIFAIDLTSYLSLQYSLPRSLSVAKLCLNVLSTLLGLLLSDTRIEMFRVTLACVVRFGEAFPPLLEDCTQFLLQLGRIAESQAALGRSVAPLPVLALAPESKLKVKSRRAQYAEKLIFEIRQAFADMIDRAVFKTRMY